MKIINTGSVYEIYSDNLKVYDKLPPKTYSVNFSQMTGFYLAEHPDMEIKEKVYGTHEAKVEKVLCSFSDFNRNLGVILSGDKGIGKSLFAKLLCIKAQERQIPVLIVDRFIPGIAKYISSIDQEVLVMFDEFDKTFGNIKTGENEADPQAGLLSLFDGISTGKKLFVITCNELHNVNDYLVNRPGRFHYHFRFGYPSGEEIREYLHDSIMPDYYDQIDKVVSFSTRVGVNYDCLRAIAFELNRGEPFEKAIEDLNIVNTHNERYDLVLYLSDGSTLQHKQYQVDLFGDSSIVVSMYNNKRENVADIQFETDNASYNQNVGATVIGGDDISIVWYSDDEQGERIKLLEPLYMTITRRYNNSIHYTV